MPRVPTRDGIELYCEEAGSGTPVVFVHEYAADYRTWEPQMRHFSRSHRCVTFSQRGYPPSDIPKEPDKYLQDAFRDDVIAVMDALNNPRSLRVTKGGNSVTQDVEATCGGVSSVVALAPQGPGDATSTTASNWRSD